MKKPPHDTPGLALGTEVEAVDLASAKFTVAIFQLAQLPNFLANQVRNIGYWTG